MKDIKDYIHLYIGCSVMDFYNDKIGELTGVDKYGVQISHRGAWTLNVNEIKPILRRLSSMTECEIKDLFQYDKLTQQYKDVSFERIMFNDTLTGITVNYIVHDDDEDIGYPNSWTLEFCSMNAADFKWLLSKGFDLFGLIDSGLAIDKDTLK